MENVLYKFNKKRGKKQVIIYEDHKMSKDGWFLSVDYIETASNKVTHSQCIILNDLEKWVYCLKKDGWILNQ